MNPIADILVIVDPTVVDHPAVAKARMLARWLGAAIELLVCDTKASRDMRLAATLAGRRDASHGDGLQELLDRLAEPLRLDRIEVTTHVIRGDPLHETVVSWMRNSTADLVVKDTHHHSLAKRTFITNTDWNLIRACPVPLLLTKPGRWGVPPVLMAAIDPGHADDEPAGLDHRILDVTVSLAKRIGAEVQVVHAYSPAVIAMAGGGGLPPMMAVSAQALAAEREFRKSQIKNLADEYGIESANQHVDEGVAIEYLPRMAAECRADVVVMGAISRGALKRVLIGSTAERVLDTLPCDVLVVKPPNFALDLPF